MLIPDNINPKFSLYYNGGLIIEELSKSSTQTFFDLYQKIKEKNDISISVFILSLDWLFIANIVESNEKGDVVLCSSNL